MVYTCGRKTVFQCISSFLLFDNFSLDGLNINPNTMKANTSKGHQWNPRGETKLTGGNNYQMRNVTPSTLPPMNTMGGMGGAPMGGMQPQGMMGMNSMGMMGQQQFQMQQQQQFYGMNQRVCITKLCFKNKLT